VRKHNFQYCTYTHSIDGVVFYVGSGTYDRPYAKGRVGKDRNERWFEIVNSNNGQYDINIVLQSNDKNSCLQEEIRLTECYKAKGEAAANQKIGNFFDEVTKNKISEYAKTRTKEQNPFYGKHHSAETIEKIRLKNIGKKDSAETNAKKAQYGKDNPSSRECVAIFDNGTAKEYDMIKDLINDLGCSNASAYARGVMGIPQHYWRAGECYIYYKEEYNKLKGEI
jgi:hypothetical protein